MFWLNRYTLIIENKSELHIVTGAAGQEMVLRPTSVQRKMLDDLMSGESKNEEDMMTAFGEVLIKTLYDGGVLLTEKPKDDDIFSRTNAYFEAYGMKDARAKLSQKDVIILGCGGIGTHMAWHLTALGVKSITLLDFDTVEESNLNRQILFDRNDIGRCKAEVLKEKRYDINEQVSVSVIAQKVTSEEQLETILTAVHYDLIVKALDSPAAFPLWLDSVCKKHGLTYISGITLRENAVIGPTYIPGKSKIGWSELLPPNDGSQKLHGTAPSLGAVLYHVSDEVAIEALKILTGYGTPKYIDKLLFRNIISGEENTVGNKKPIEDTLSMQNSSSKEIILSTMVVILMTVLGTFFWPMQIIVPAATLLFPFMLYKQKTDILKMTFITATTYALTMFAVCFFSGFFSVLAGSALQAVLLSMIAFGIISILILCFCALNYGICKFKRI